MSHNFKFSFLARHKSDNEICSKIFLIYFEIQKTLNHRIYILLMMMRVHFTQDWTYIQLDRRRG